MNVDLVAVAEADKAVLANLLQLYQYDFSEYRNYELTPHGTFVYRYLDSYFTEPARESWFITVAGELAGFALTRGDVDDDDSWNVGEFFVVRKYRRKGVARAAARQLFGRHPGAWTLTFDHDNLPAVALWPSLAADLATGSVDQVDRYPPVVAYPGTRLRFEVVGPNS